MRILNPSPAHLSSQALSGTSPGGGAGRTIRFSHIGGPTLLIEIGAVRLLTDPTFDPAGTTYDLGDVTLVKQSSPSLAVRDLQPIDAVLLSHDQHFDNLDTNGRAFLPRARSVLTTPDGARRLSESGADNALGMVTWSRRTVTSADASESVTITSTPARHGPPGAERASGHVTGFCIEWPGSDGAIYISGDTVWFEGIAEVARRFRISTAVLFMGAAIVSSEGSEPRTMTADEAVTAARALSPHRVVPMHYEGWAHLTQGRADITRTFEEAGMGTLLTWLELGQVVQLP